MRTRALESIKKNTLQMMEALTIATQLVIRAHQYDQQAEELLDDARWCRETAATYPDTEAWQVEVTLLQNTADSEEREAQTLRQCAEQLRYEAAQQRNKIFIR